MKITHVGLWLDNIGDPGNPAWIVSLDTRDDRGEVETSATEFAFPVVEDEDGYAMASEAAEALGRERGLPVIETDPSGETETVYEPPKCAGCDRNLTDKDRAEVEGHDTGGEARCLACHLEMIEADPDLECAACGRGARGE